MRKVQSLSEIEQNTRTAINDHLDKLRKEKYEKIDEIDQKQKKVQADTEEEKKRQYRKEIEDIKERQEQKDRELRREQKLIEDLQYEQQTNQRSAIMPPPQQQYIMAPQQRQPQYQPPQVRAVNPLALKEAEKLIRDAGYGDDFLSGLRDEGKIQLAVDIRKFLDLGSEIEEVKAHLEQVEQTNKKAQKMNQNLGNQLDMAKKEAMLKSALSNANIEKKLTIQILGDALKEKLEKEGHEVKGWTHNKRSGWIVKKIIEHKIDVGD